MNNLSSIIKYVIIAAVISGVGYVAYTYLNKVDPAAQIATGADLQTSDAAKASAEIIANLNKLKSLSLDGSIFTDRAFVSLHGTTTLIEADPVGRNNPFAPIGVESPRSTVINVPVLTNNVSTASSTKSATTTKTATTSKSGTTR